MQHLSPAPSALLWIIPGLGFVAAAGSGAAWLSARLAHGRRPGLRETIWTIVTGLLVTASAAVGRPDELGWSLGLGWVLLVLASVDLAVLRLPDVLTLPLMGVGLARAAVLDDDLVAHAAGLVVGYGSIALTGWAFMRLRGRRGVGLGDAKLFAAAGAWLGWAPLPSVMLTACGLGLAGFALAFLRQGRSVLHVQAPFGVALCLATWGAWLLA